MANLVAILGMRESWGADYVRAAYRRWFQLGQGDRKRAQRVKKLARCWPGPSRNLLVNRAGYEALPSDHVGPITGMVLPSEACGGMAARSASGEPQSPDLRRVVIVLANEYSLGDWPGICAAKDGKKGFGQRRGRGGGRGISQRIERAAECFVAEIQIGPAVKAVAVLPHRTTIIAQRRYGGAEAVRCDLCATATSPCAGYCETAGTKGRAVCDDPCDERRQAVWAYTFRLGFDAGRHGRVWCPDVAFLIWL